MMDKERYEVLAACLEDLSDLISRLKAVGDPTRPYEEFLEELESTAGSGDSEA